MSARVTPLDPNSPKGVEVARTLTIILTELRANVEARRAAAQKTAA